jgi:hypothetical protein
LTYGLPGGRLRIPGSVEAEARPSFNLEVSSGLLELTSFGKRKLSFKPGSS